MIFIIRCLQCFDCFSGWQTTRNCFTNCKGWRPGLSWCNCGKLGRFNKNESSSAFYVLGQTCHCVLTLGTAIICFTCADIAELWPWWTSCLCICAFTWWVMLVMALTVYEVIWFS